MLRLMRKKAQSWMIKILFAVIIIVFVFFYGYGRRSGARRVIAEVNGTKIMDSLFISKYQKAYQNLARLYQNIYRDQFDEGMIDRVALRERVLNDLIDETLLVQQTEKLGLHVTPQELQAAVHSNPAFQVDGKFSEQRFMAVLQMNQMGVDEFEEMEERSRLITKVTDLITLGGVDVSDQEVFDAYGLANEKINLQFARFNPTTFEKSISTDESELDAYYSKHNTLFEIPPRVQVQYLIFAPDDFLKAVEISPEEIREEYEYNLDEYRVPKRVKVSHILIKVHGDNGEKAVEEAREKAEQILEEAKKGDGFAALARMYSEDKDSARNGGSIGWVKKGEKVPEFAEAAFSLEKGEFAPLVESEDGFHIVKAEDVQEERVESLEEVEGRIRAKLAKFKSRQLAEEETQEAFFSIYETKDLEIYAAQQGKPLMTTGLFSRDEQIKEVGGNLEFNREAFSLEEGAVSSPLEIGGKLYLLKVIKREAARVPAFEDVKEQVREEFVREKAMEKAKAAAEEMLREIKSGKSLAESAGARGLKLEETGFFERGGTYVPKVGPTRAFGKEVFSLSPDRSLLERVVSYGKVFFVMELKEQQKIDMEKFESEKEQYKKRLYAEKRGHIVQQWLESLRKKSEIKIREENVRL